MSSLALLLTYKLNIMKKLSLLVILLCTLSLSAFAQSCNGFGGVLKSAWKELYTSVHPIGQEALTLIPVVGQNATAVNAISEASVKFHNFVFNENSQSWTTLGPRALPVQKDQIKQYGTLVKAGVGGVRVFNTTGMLWDRVEIEIEKTGGKAQTDIIICTWDLESGAKNNYTEYSFPNGKDTSTKKFIIKNVHGKSISVKLKNNSFSNKFKYAIKTKGFLNIAKQKKRAVRLQNIAKKDKEIIKMN
jgi:hypothetical protein